MHVVHPFDYTLNNRYCFLLGQSFDLSHFIEEVPVHHQLLDEVNVLVVIKHAVHLSDIRMGQGHVDCCFPHYLLFHLLLSNNVFGDNLQSKQTTKHLMSDKKHVSEIALPQLFSNIEILLGMGVGAESKFGN